MNQSKQKTERLIQNNPFAMVGANVKTFLTSSLRQLDVVTREEFDVQVAMLAKTRERLEVLERKIAGLELGDKTT